MTFGLMRDRVRRPVRFLSRTTTTDSVGGVATVSWVLFARAKATVVPLSSAERASERFEGDQLNARTVVRYELRHFIDGLTHEMRMEDRHSGTTFEIVGIRPPAERGHGQRVDCAVYAD